jgi:hypothetical protein
MDRAGGRGGENGLHGATCTLRAVAPGANTSHGDGSHALARRN